MKINRADERMVDATRDETLTWKNNLANIVKEYRIKKYLMITRYMIILCNDSQRIACEVHLLSLFPATKKGG